MRIFFFKLNDVYGKVRFRPNMFLNGLNMSLQILTEVEKKHPDIIKKKFQAPHSVLKMMLIMFSDMKGSILIDFLEKGATVRNAYYYQDP